ncbi:MAG TPA: immunoglobulin domain-containing protein, partial [Candidatus Paceibacterota bacterium]|nr:immunoglobulin domain-containing protein [Candidatus Paceibacterota bacterium]
ASAPLTLLRPPVITYRTPNQIVRAGTNVTLQVAAAGDSPFGYCWSFNGTNFPTTLSYLTLANLQPSASGIYTVTVTNRYGGASTNISLVVVDSAPYITRQPYQMPNQMNVSNLTVAPGGSAGWSVDARGSLPLAYQWRFNGADIQGATNSSLALSNLTPGQSGFYNVIVQNAFGEAISAKVLLNVNQVSVYGSGPATNVPFGLTNVIALAAGNSHVLALKSDRSVVAWGGGRSGIVSPTNVPAAATNVIAIAANNETSMALRGDGRVVVWGLDPMIINTPFAVSNIMAIACGGFHCLALNTNGTVFAWGASSYGVSTVPPALSNSVVAVAAGMYFNAALKTDGRVFVWGSNSYGVTNVPAGLSNVIAIAAGSDHILTLKSDGRIVAWGNNYYGQTNVPLYVYTPTMTPLTNVVAIAAGNGVSLALTADGTLVSWGNTSSVGTQGGLKGRYPTNVIAMTASKGPQSPMFVVTAGGNGMPFVTVNPVTQNTGKGAVVRLHARAVGVQPMRYQWQLNGSDISGGTNGDLTITNFQTLNAGVYRVAASNRLGVAISQDAWVRIPYSGSFSTALNFTNVNWYSYSSTSKVDGVWFPQNVETYDGDAAVQSGRIGDNQKSTLQTTVVGPGTLTFWWKVSSEQGYDFLSFIVDGSAIPTAKIGGEVDWHQITCVLKSGTHTVTWVYSKDGSVSSGRDAGWVDQVALVRPSPTITVQPVGKVAALGDSLYVGIQATGASPLNYQWMKDGVEIPGATGGWHFLTNVSRCDSGTYAARVWNSDGSVLSSNAVVRVRVPQRLTAMQPSANGALRWSSVDVNGGSLTPADLDRFEVQASTNLTDWIPLPGALFISNGALQFQDSDTNAYAQRFYRVIER